MNAEARIKELGLDLSRPPSPVANYVPAVTTGNLIYLSGHGPGKVSGKVGAEISKEEAYQAARQVGVNLLATLRQQLGDLDRVTRIVKVLGMVNAAPEFKEHPAVINGCSDLMVDVFGDNGRHARSAIGMGSLPMGIPVEIEMIVEFK